MFRRNDPETVVWFAPTAKEVVVAKGSWTAGFSIALECIMV